MVKTVSLEVAQKALRRLLEEVKSDKDQYVIQENDRPVAVLVSLMEYQAFLQMRSHPSKKEIAYQDLIALLEEVHARNAQFTEEEVERDVWEAIQAVRQSGA